MNEKFYALQEEKQSQILNAAYKVFATNQYKKAPTSEIAAEAGISKSLLFHYFHNKLEMYIFLLNPLHTSIEKDIAPVYYENNETKVT